MLCDLLCLKILDKLLLLEYIEFVSDFYKCFDFVVMLIGVLSLEVYEVLVIVMNCLGGYFNLGEGGEDLCCFGIECNLCIK